MFSIEQSAFLQALGKAIGNSIWQVAALWLVYMALSSVGKLSANRKYQFAAGASLAGLVLFIGTFIISWINTPLHPAASGIFAETTTDVSSSAMDYLLYIYHSAATSLRSLAPYISCAYLFMFLLLSIRLVNGFRQVRFFATANLEKASVDVRLFIEQHAAALGISRKVQIFTSRHIQSPLTLGFLKPLILLPVASLNHLTTAQVESILLHELAHIRRHDYLVNILLQIAETSLFFNPFMRLLLKQVKQERENSCDDYVLQFQYSPRDYAKALLAIEHSNNRTLLALAAKGTQSFQLLNRVKRMVAPEPKAFNYRQQLGLLLLFTVLILSFTVIVPHPKKANQKKQQIAVTEKLQIKQAAYLSTENTTAVSTHLPELSASAPQKALDLVKMITHHYTDGNFPLDEKATAAITQQIEKGAAKYDQIGKNLEKQMKPFTKQVESWGKDVGKMDWQAWGENIGKLDWQAWGEELSKVNWEAAFKDSIATAVAMAKINANPFNNSPNNEKQKGKALMIHMDNLKNLLPEDFNINIESVLRNINIAFRKHDQQQRRIDRAKEQQLAALAEQEEYVHQQVRKNLSLQKLEQEMAAKQAEIKKLELTARQLEALAKTQELHLGLFTDDRDSTINGLLASVQKRFNPLQFRIKYKLPNIPAPSIHIKNKCEVSASEDSRIRIVTEDGEDEWPAVHSNNQNIDVQQSKQVNSNGKEEKVVVISINSSR